MDHLEESIDGLALHLLTNNYKYWRTHSPKRITRMSLWGSSWRLTLTSQNQESRLANGAIRNFHVNVYITTHPTYVQHLIGSPSFSLKKCTKFRLYTLQFASSNIIPLSRPARLVGPVLFTEYKLIIQPTTSSSKRVWEPMRSEELRPLTYLWCIILKLNNIS